MAKFYESFTPIAIKRLEYHDLLAPLSNIESILWIKRTFRAVYLSSYYNCVFREPLAMRDLLSAGPRSFCCLVLIAIATLV